jgi:hypothetical protein
MSVPAQLRAVTEDDADPDAGVDYAWVMQTTFVVTIVVGVPVVVVLSLLLKLPDWGARVEFAVRVGALVWILTALSVFVYARRNDVGGTAPEERDALRGGGEDGDDGSAPAKED